MTTITVPSTNATPEQISQTLRAGLGRRYHPLPPTQGTLHPAAIVIGTGSSPLWHTQVRIDRHSRSQVAAGQHRVTDLQLRVTVVEPVAGSTAPHHLSHRGHSCGARPRGR